jgi:tRNA A-37 threonylcarbamoyl transferase component Bud32
MTVRALYASSPEWAALGGTLDQLVHTGNFRVVKKNSRTLAGIVRANGSEIFLKRVTYDSWIKGIVVRLRGSRARRTIRGAAVLRHAGLAHPKLLAAFEQRCRGSVSVSYVLVEYLRRPKVLSRFALADGHDFRWRRMISGRLAQEIRNLHYRGCYTRDLQETNLMLEMQNSMLKIYFADLEDFRRLPRVPWRFRLRNLIQLDRSIGRFLSRAHRLRFLHDYVGYGASHSKLRVLVVRLDRTRQRIERRRLRHQRSTAIVTPTMDSAQPKAATLL